MCNCDFLEVSPVAVDIPLREEEFENLVTVNYSISNENDRINWSSSDENVLEVVEGYKGRTVKIRTKSLGMASVLAESDANPNMCDSCFIRVVETLPATRLDLNKKNIEIIVDCTYQLKGTVVPSFATTKEIIWSSDDTKIATVSKNGLVTAKNQGTANITATVKGANNIVASCKVEVKYEVPIEAITFVNGEYYTDVFTPITLNTAVFPTNASYKKLKCISSDSSIVKVSSSTGTSNKVYPRGVGRATVTAIATDGSEIYGYCVVNVSHDCTKPWNSWEYYADRVVEEALKFNKKTKTQVNEMINDIKETNTKITVSLGKYWCVDFVRLVCQLAGVLNKDIICDTSSSPSLLKDIRKNQPSRLHGVYCCDVSDIKRGDILFIKNKNFPDSEVYHTCIAVSNGKNGEVETINGNSGSGEGMVQIYKYSSDPNKEESIYAYSHPNYEAMNIINYH